MSTIIKEEGYYIGSGRIKYVRHIISDISYDKRYKKDKYHNPSHGYIKKYNNKYYFVIKTSYPYSVDDEYTYYPIAKKKANKLIKRYNLRYEEE